MPLFAKRMKTFSDANMVTRHPGSLEKLNILSAMFLASCLLNMFAPLVRYQHVDLPEASGGASMTHGIDLRRFPFSIVWKTVLLPISPAGDSIAGLPEIRRPRLIRNARDHTALLAALDFPECIATELEIVALLIDGITAGSFDKDPILNAADKIVQRCIRLRGRKPDVGHALERHAGPRIGVATSARFGLADQMRLVPDGLVVRKDSLLDDREARCFHAVVVILHGRQPELRGAIAKEIHQIAADTEFTHLVSGEKTGARIIRFVTQGAVQLRGVPNRLLIGKEEMAGKKNQIFLARRYRRRTQMFHHFVGDSARVLAQIHHRHIFPS